MTTFPMLSILIFLPVVAAAGVMLIPRAARGAIRATALVAALADLALAILVLSLFRADATGMQFVERVPWVPSLGVEYHLGLDGISLFLVVLATLLTAIAVGACWPLMEERAKEYGVLLLLLEAGVVGAFVALDLVLFFVFWEVMLIPMVLLIGICGGPQRIAASVKFFLYTAVGSLLMLLGIIVLYFQAGGKTFNLLALLQTPVSREAQFWLFLAFALAFAIKVPIFPLHTWLPDAYAQAPTPALVLGTMLTKVGAYGFLRLCVPLFPAASADWAPILSTLAVIGLLYGGLVALAQRDLIRLLAYSSLAHLAYIVLGIFALNPVGVAGGLLQMVNHGISTGALFLLAAMLVDRVRTGDLADFGGAGARWPVLAGFMLVSAFASLGLPGLNGFAGEFLVLLGVFQARALLAVVGTVGVVVTAAYILWMVRRAMHGPARGAVQAAQAGDLTGREVALLAPLAVLMVIIGLFPTVLLSRMEGSVNEWLAVSQRRLAAVQPVGLARPEGDASQPGQEGRR